MSFADHYMAIERLSAAVINIMFFRPEDTPFPLFLRLDTRLPIRLFPPLRLPSVIFFFILFPPAPRRLLSFFFCPRPRLLFFHHAADATSFLSGNAKKHTWTERQICSPRSIHISTDYITLIHMNIIPVSTRQRSHSTIITKHRGHGRCAVQGKC